MKLNYQTSAISKQSDTALDIRLIFWQQWQQYQDYLYHCCVKWMGGNSTDAEDALSRAMLKAWEKAQKFAGEIANFKAWLTTLTRNLCVDIHRERSRDANRVEDIEIYASGEQQGLVYFENTPEIAVENSERKIVIRRAIDNLPTRLRETFILHFYQELSYQEIAQQQDISYQNVCKRISQSRKILQEELRGYFIGEEGTDRDKSVTLTATESEIGEMSEGNGGVEAEVGETVLAVAVEEEEIVGSEEAQEQSESVMVVATSEGKLEVKRDACWCVEVALCERQFAPILALAQFDEETGSRGNSCLAVQRRQQQHQVAKGWGGHGVIIAETNEAYTSKTCGKCGHIHTKLGGNKVFKCPECGYVAFRDANGAFNIMLKALAGTPFTFTSDDTLGFFRCQLCPRCLKYIA